VSQLPAVSSFAVDAVMDMLLSEQGMNRPPEKAAALLALIVELYKRKQPFPRREEVAAAIGASVSTVDAALSSRIDEGYITPVVETKRGNVQRRNSAVRERYYIPSDGLIAVVEKAKRREARAR
jgi:hypothetical protein